MNLLDKLPDFFVVLLFYWLRLRTLRSNYLAQYLTYNKGQNIVPREEG